MTSTGVNRGRAPVSATYIGPGVDVPTKAVAAMAGSESPSRRAPVRRKKLDIALLDGATSSGSQSPAPAPAASATASVGNPVQSPIRGSLPPPRVGPVPESRSSAVTRSAISPEPGYVSAVANGPSTPVYASPRNATPVSSPIRQPVGRGWSGAAPPSMPIAHYRESSAMSQGSSMLANPAQGAGAGTASLSSGPPTPSHGPSPAASLAPPSVWPQTVSPCAQSHAGQSAAAAVGATSRARRWFQDTRAYFEDLAHNEPEAGSVHANHLFVYQGEASAIASREEKMRIEVVELKQQLRRIQEDRDALYAEMAKSRKPRTTVDVAKPRFTGSPDEKSSTGVLATESPAPASPFAEDRERALAHAQKLRVLEARAVQAERLAGEAALAVRSAHAVKVRNCTIELAAQTKRAALLERQVRAFGLMPASQAPGALDSVEGLAEYDLTAQRVAIDQQTQHIARSYAEYCVDIHEIEERVSSGVRILAETILSQAGVDPTTFAKERPAAVEASQDSDEVLAKVGVTAPRVIRKPLAAKLETGASDPEQMAPPIDSLPTATANVSPSKQSEKVSTAAVYSKATPFDKKDEEDSNIKVAQPFGLPAVAKKYMPIEGSVTAKPEICQNPTTPVEDHYVPEKVAEKRASPRKRPLPAPPPCLPATWTQLPENTTAASSGRKAGAIVSTRSIDGAQNAQSKPNHSNVTPARIVKVSKPVSVSSAPTKTTESDSTPSVTADKTVTKPIAPSPLNNKPREHTTSLSTQSPSPSRTAAISVNSPTKVVSESPKQGPTPKVTTTASPTASPTMDVLPSKLATAQPKPNNDVGTNFLSQPLALGDKESKASNHTMAKESSNHDSGVIVLDDELMGLLDML